MNGLGYVQAYLEDLLFATNNTFDNHLSKLGTVFQRLHAEKL
jgi:hypothetical protein